MVADELVKSFGTSLFAEPELLRLHFRVLLHFRPPGLKKTLEYWRQRYLDEKEAKVNGTTRFFNKTVYLDNNLRWLAGKLKWHK